MTTNPESQPIPPILKLVKGDRQPTASVDISAPILPEWLRKQSTFRSTVRGWRQRNSYRLRHLSWNLPLALALLVLYSPRGLARVTAILARYLYDHDSAQVRHEHAGRVETADYVRAQNVRKANLRARWLVAGTVALVVLGPLLAWIAPRVLAVLAGVAVCTWIVKLIPGRSLTELVFGVLAGGATAWNLPLALALLPRPSAWALWLALALVVLALGWVGRPKGKPLGTPGKYEMPAELVKPTAEMIVDALCRIGVPGMTVNAADRVRDEIRIIAPGVATSAYGYTIELELPPGITAEMIVAKRGPLAGALRRDLGCIWPSGNEDRHPGYLRLFLSHKPMNKATQPGWPLAAGKPVDIFEPMPLFTDEEMRWVSLTLAGTPHLAVGGASGFGKSVWLRQLSCGVAFDPRVRIVVVDGKRSGDLDHVRKLAHAFHEGADPEDVAAVVTELRGLVAEYLKRSKFLSSLPPEERSPKVTSALASRYPAELSPIVVFYDEVQEGTQYGIKSSREDKAIREEITGQLTRLSRVGRSAGIYLVLASQRPEADVIPSSIMGNCSIRVAFKVSDQTHNDQILGTSARKNGIDATMFGTRDKGMAWLKGGDDVDAQVVRSWSAMVDVGLAVELADKAYEMRRSRGMLTGAAAGEVAEDEARQVDLVADVREVMDEQAGRNMSLTGIREALELLRPRLYGHLDNEALGGLFRGAGVTPDSIHCPAEGRTARGVKRAWLDIATDVWGDGEDDPS